MSGLAFSQAPPASLPLRFLFACCSWGLAAGLWIAWQGPGALVSRWLPATLVLTHMMVLGVLGNAILGSLIQFLPVAAGSPLPWQRGLAWLFAIFNLGILSLLVALAGHSAAVAMAAGILLFTSLVPFVGLGLLAVVRGHGKIATRSGIGLSLLALLVTASVGVILLAARSGWLSPALPALANLHAMIGVLGWVVGTLVAVGAIAAPMLQGLSYPSRYWRWLWYTSLSVSLLLTALMVLPQSVQSTHPSSRWLLAAPLLLFALAVLVLQRRSPHQRNPVLRKFWQFGCLTLLIGGLIATSPVANPYGQWMLLAGLIVIMLGLPMLILGMTLEITAFLTWIELRQQVPRGQRIPGVGSLMPQNHKQWVLHLYLLAGSLLVLAALSHHQVLTAAAGISFAGTWLLGLGNLWRCWHQQVSFVASSEPYQSQ